MFSSARLKLTTWYLLIIMLISLIFSLVIYRGVTIELERGSKRVELQLKAYELGIKLPQPIPHHPEELRLELRNLRPRFSLLQDLREAKHRVKFYLLLANGAILVFSAAAGYFLADKTLKPIEKALEEQKRFVADASHELRTPLTALKTSIEVALRDKKIAIPGFKKVLKDNLDDVNNLQSLTDNLLTSAQHQKSNQDLLIEPVSIKDIMEEAVRKMLPLAKKKDIDMKLNAGSYPLEADKASLTKLIIILLDNAIKYTPKGGRVFLSAEATKKHLVIKVRDTGIGIDKKHLPFIFGRFYRVDKSRAKAKASGFGLGLSLAKRIIEMHKGSIGVSSLLGKGATFTIKLPLKHS